MKRWILTIFIAILGIVFLFLLWQKYVTPERLPKPTPIQTQEIFPPKNISLDITKDAAGNVIAAPSSANQLLNFPKNNEK
ncbi:hypothetical protein HN954_04490 [bacterium]|jgi:hypothetical protein|nr:hypothetical protein [bacterium]MBT6831961.1 hypothetical protein [bacterium]MBT6996657.1 hypothetical protein [bacterium]MBT7773077.1 hypothetical protein [bacterium]